MDLDKINEKEITVKIYKHSRSKRVRIRVETTISGKGLLTSDQDHAKEAINTFIELAIKELNPQQKIIL